MKYLIIISTLMIVVSCYFGMVLSESDVRVKRQQPQKQNYQEPVVNYRPLNQAPAGIQQLLQLQQAREPLVHIPAQPAPNFNKAPSQNQNANIIPQYNQPSKPQYNPLPAPAPPQQQQPQYNQPPQQQQQQPQPHYRPQYIPQQQQPQQPQYQG